MRQGSARRLTGLLVLMMLLTACQGGAAASPVPTQVELTPTPAPPTEVPTPEAAATPAEIVVETTSNIPYVEGASDPQKVDLYFVAGQTTPYPAVFLAWPGQTRLEVKGTASELAKSGYTVVVATQHRASYQTRLEGVHCAFAWLHASADTYNLDPQRIYVMGVGTFATLAIQLARTEDATPYLTGCEYPWPEAPRMQGIIVQTGVFDFTDMSDTPAIIGRAKELFGASYEEAPELRTEASPLLEANDSLPPHLLISPKDFDWVPKAASEAYAEALEQAGVDVTLLIVPDTDLSSVQTHLQTLEAIQAFTNGQ